MAVLLKEQVVFDGEKQTINVFYPSGVISPEERRRAKDFDDYLEKNIPQIAKKVLQQSESKTVLFRWHLFGRELKRITKTNGISAHDIESGAVWKAVRQYLPAYFPLKKRNELSKYRREKRDHLALCYLLADFDWKDVKWLKTWSNWKLMFTRKGIVGDERVFRALGASILKLGEMPAPKRMEMIVSAMVEEFPRHGGKKIDSKVWSDEEISEKVSSIVKKFAN